MRNGNFRIANGALADDYASFLVYIFGRNGKDGNDAHGIKRQAKQRIVSGMMAFCAFSQFFLYTVLNTRHLNNGTTLAKANKLFCLHEQSDIYLS